MDTKTLMEAAVARARKTMTEGLGGPFGAVVVAPDGETYVASNTVLSSKDPTAHAEINAIRLACKKRGTHDLSGCVLYTTCFPCPMCMAAVIWANIKEIWYGSTAKDAAHIGFRDDFIYDFMKKECQDEQVMKIHHEGREITIKLFDEYLASQGTRY